jgi:hypothetical protein
VTKAVATVIYLGIGSGMWWFMHSRVRILGRTEEAGRITRRNTVLVVGVFGILIVQTWVPSGARTYVGGIGIAAVLLTYTVMLALSIRRRRSEYQEV